MAPPVGGVWCLGWNPSAPALQHLPVAASERGSRERCGDSIQNGAPSFSHTLSGCQTQAFLFLDAYGIQLSGVCECEAPVCECASRGRPSSGFFLLLSLSAVLLAASDAALLFSGNERPLLDTGNPSPMCQVELPPSEVDEGTVRPGPKSFKIIQLSALVCGAVGVLQPISAGLPSEEDAKRIVEERPS